MIDFHWFWLPILAVLVFRFWYANLQARELATRFAEQACRLRQLQFLDGTVALQRFALEQAPGARLRGLVRLYEFAFSDNGARRHIGIVVMRGMRIERLDLPPLEPPTREEEPPVMRPRAVVLPFRPRPREKSSSGG